MLVTDVQSLLGESLYFPYYGLLHDHTLMEFEDFLVPLAQTALLNLLSVFTSSIPIPFLGDGWISECQETHCLKPSCA